MNKIIPVIVIGVGMLFITYSIGHSRGSKLSSDDCRDIARDLIIQMMVENGGELVIRAPSNSVCSATVKRTSCSPVDTLVVMTNTKKIAESNWLPAGVFRDFLVKVIPDLIDRPVNTVRINGAHLDMLPINTKIEEVDLIEIIDGSVTNVVYRRPPRLKKGNHHYGNSATRKEK